jgi:CopG family transcriptional regulator/antitoxin EndoAI
VTEARRANLRKRLKEGALRRAERDVRLAEESFFLEEEAWHANAR